MSESGSFDSERGFYRPSGPANSGAEQPPQTPATPPRAPIVVPLVVSASQNRQPTPPPPDEGTPGNTTTESKGWKPSSVAAAIALLGVVGTVGAGYAWSEGILSIGKPATPVHDSLTPSPQPTVTSEASPTAPATVSPSETPTPTATNSKSLQCVNALPLKVLFGQKLVASIYGDTLTASAKVFRDNYVGTAILMTAPQNPNDGSIKKFKDAQQIPIRVGVDQEDGTVQRFKHEPAALPSALDLAKLPKITDVEQEVFKSYDYLHSIGITAVFAPVADVAPLKGTTTEGASRVFSSDPNIVAAYDKAYLDAAKRAHVHATLKHFPGIGSADGNTDRQKAHDPSLSELKKRDLVPFTLLKDTDADVMVGSPRVPGLTGNVPASLSPKTYELLRQIGYTNAVVYTDDLATPAINLPVEEAIVKAWEAGADVPMFVNPAKGQTVESTIKAAVSLGEAAVKSGKLKRAQVNASALNVFENKGIDPCSVKVMLTKAPAEQTTPTSIPSPTKTPAPTATTKPTSATAAPTKKVTTKPTASSKSTTSK